VAWNTIGRGDYLSEKQASCSKFALSRAPNRKTCWTQTRLAGLKAEITAGEPMISSSAEPYTWIWVDAPYLREQAQRCTRLARDCPHLPTAHELEAIGVELMQKAAELDHLQEDRDAERSTRE
jgi:hypothetical protein